MSGGLRSTIQGSSDIPFKRYNSQAGSEVPKREMEETLQFFAKTCMDKFWARPKTNRNA